MQSEVITALPTGADADSPLLRNYLIKRTIYPIADDEDPEAFEALDADTGAIPRGIAWGGIIFWLDPDDTTTAHDGVTCLVTVDGYRYKYDGVDYLIRSVLDKDLTAPPGSEAYGDAYIVGAGATGAWAGHSEKIAIYTSRDWKFILPRIGQIVYVEDEDAYYHYDVAGNWVGGFGDSALSANSVTPASMLGGRTHWVIVNRTTNTPPGSPTTGVAYIIGSSPTGVWAGHAAKIAVYDGASWTIIAPAEGYEAFDQGVNAFYFYNGSAWVIAGGVIVAFATVAVVGTTGTTAPTGTTVYSYSTGTAPTTSQRRLIDTGTEVTHTARSTGSRLRFSYRASTLARVITAATHAGSPSGFLVAALYRDSEANALDWCTIDDGSPTAVTLGPLLVALETTAADASPHTYRVALVSWALDANGDYREASGIGRRRLSLDEYAL